MLVIHNDLKGPLGACVWQAAAELLKHRTPHEAQLAELWGRIGPKVND